MAERISNDIPRPDDVSVLEDKGFINALKHRAFDDRGVNEFGWGNRNDSAVRWLLQSYPISSDIAETLCSVFSGPPYSFDIQKTLKQFFLADPVKKAEFQDAAAMAGKTIPSTLVSEVTASS